MQVVYLFDNISQDLKDSEASSYNVWQRSGVCISGPECAVYIRPKSMYSIDTLCCSLPRCSPPLVMSVLSISPSARAVYRPCCRCCLSPSLMSAILISSRRCHSKWAEKRRRHPPARFAPVASEPSPGVGSPTQTRAVGSGTTL